MPSRLPIRRVEVDTWWRSIWLRRFGQLPSVSLWLRPSNPNFLVWIMRLCVQFMDLRGQREKCDEIVVSKLEREALGILGP